MNPYTLVFGKEPAQRISRIAQNAQIIESFNEDIPSQQVYMITGVRGSGKTVFMTEIAKKLMEDNRWIKVELNIGIISENYKKIFRLDNDHSLEMARLTRGYSFAFQVLGYFTWESGGKYTDILGEYRQYLDEYVYDKI